MTTLPPDSLPDSTAPAEARPITRDSGDSNHIQLWRVVVLSILGLGLIYWLYWMYRTWKQYRDHTGAEAYPVWHMLTQLVPIYGWFRLYAHGEAYKKLLDEREVPNNLKPGIPVAVLVIGTASSWLEGIVGAILETTGSYQALEYLSFAGGIVTVIWLFAVLAAVCWVQHNINKYWHSVNGGTSRNAPIGKGEILVLIVGTFLLLAVLFVLWSFS